MNVDQTLLRPVVRLAITTASLLLIPLAAMQFTSEVVWSFFDFVIAGCLLFGTGMAYILATRTFAAGTGSRMRYRFATGFALFSVLFMVWVNLTVGIIGSENNAFNLVYFAVAIGGIIGSVFVRLRPAGMVRVMFAMALTMAVIAGIALFSGMQYLPESSVTEILAVNGLFALMFITSGFLYRYSVRANYAAESATI
jgi:hypothetical protein